MDSELKAKWVKALRSGEFKQTTGSLKKGNCFCCLGVLAHVAGISFDDSDQPKAADDWDGNYHTLLPLPSEETALALYERNDGLGGHHKYSFPEIADYIEKNL